MGVFGITKILEEEAFGDPKSIVRNSYGGGAWDSVIPARLIDFIIYILYL